MVLSSRTEKHVLETNREILVLKNEPLCHAGRMITKKKKIIGCCLNASVTDNSTWYKEKINASWKLESSMFRDS